MITQTIEGFDDRDLPHLLRPPYERLHGQWSTGRTLQVADVAAGS